MKAFIFLFCTSVFSFTNTDVLSQNAEITIDKDKIVSVDEVFRMLKSQTKYTFIYQEDLFNEAPKVSLKKGVISANELLGKSLDSSQFELLFDVTSKTLVVKTIPDNETAKAQSTFMVEGTISDAKGMPIPGVTVLYKEHQTRSTITDFDGKYQIEIYEGEPATLEFTSIGFVKQTVKVGGRTKIDIILLEDTTTLDEIVIVGYGTQKRSEISSAVSSINNDNVAKNLGANVSFDRGISGLIKGVQTIQGSGQPGKGVDINIRGVTSPFAGSDNNPLFVIDGVPFQTNPAFAFQDDTAGNEIPNPLQTINPNDIESIDVLKDASATAIYGSRGANGVIIINTKKGKKGEKTNITLSTVSTFAQPIKKPTFLNTEQYKGRIATILENTAALANQTGSFGLLFGVNGYNYLANVPIDYNTFTVSFEGLNEDWFGDADTDWADYAYRNPAYTQQYNLRVSGGSDFTTYAVTAGYTDQDGLLQTEKYKQINFRAALESQVNKYVTAGFNANLSNSDNHTGHNNQNASLNSDTMAGRPDIAPYDEFGNFNRLPGKEYGIYDSYNSSPLAKILGHQYDTNTFSLLGNTYIEVEPIKDLSLRTDVNVGRFTNAVNKFNPATVVGSIVPAFGYNATSDESSLNTTSSISTNVITNLTASYNKTLSDKHNMAAMLGLAWDRSLSERSNYYFTGFPDDNVLNNATAALKTTLKAQSELETGLNSLFSRLSYNYDEKYFLTLNFRTDRSVKFGPQNQRGYFPSLAASWNMAKESFIKKYDVIDNLRLRLGYGRSGTNNIEDFAYLQFWSVGYRDGGLYNGGQAVGLSGTLPNEGIKWENTDELNLGLDFGLFKYRLGGSIDVYNRKTTDALMAGLYPLESGATSYTENFADLTNKGVELDLYGDIIRNDDFTWSLDFNIARNVNTLDKFNEDALVSSYVKRSYELGREVNIIKGYVTDGYFQTQDEIDALNAEAPDGFYQEQGTGPGDYKYVDLNGDGEITSEDQKYLGSAQPDFFGGFSNYFGYKDFGLTANFSFSKGGETTMFADYYGLSNIPENNIETRFLDTWTPDNPNAAYPRAVLNGGYELNANGRLSDALVHDTSYFRLQSLQLSYNIPEEITGILGLDNASVNLTGTNLFTITSFPGIDPASVGGFASTLSNNTRDPYPIAKTWSLGINVKF